jgi:putative serine protease PepD
MTTNTFRALALSGATVLAAAGVSLAVVTAVGPRDGGTTTVVRQVATPQNTAATKSSSTVNQIYRNASPGVVEITVTTGSSSGSSGGFPFGGGGGNGGSQTQQAQGSGFVYDSKGDIVTDQHVIDGATSISVRFADGTTAKGTLVGSDASTDLAVVHVNVPASKLHPLPVANSDDVQVGDGAVAIGSPFGLQNTVTWGIVSALHRQQTAPNGFTIDDSIQTDAAINHGNSGGALLNMQGQVIGVTSQIESDGGGNEGVGFAVPSNTVRTIATKLISSGKVEHAYLGISAGDSSSPAGAKVDTVVTGTAASRAGLKVGDVITAVDGHSVDGAAALTQAIGGKSPNQKVTLTVSRNGSTHTVTATLGTRPSTAPTG